MALAVALHIPHVPPSLGYRPYLAKIGSRSFLRWWIDRFRARTPRAELYLLYQSEGGEAEVESVAREAGARFFRPLRSTKLGLLEALARRIGHADLAWVTFGFAFAPADLLERVYGHHLTNANNFTPVLGLPQGSFPEVYQSDLILALASLDLPGLPRDPTSAIDVLSQAAGVAGSEGPISVRAKAFDASAAYGLDSAGLPESIDLEGPEDISIATRVSREGRRSRDAAIELKLWRQARIDLRQAELHVSKKGPQSFTRRRRSETRCRVLFVSNAPAYSGSSAILCDLVHELEKAGFRTAALVGSEGLLAERLRRNGSTVIAAGRDFATPCVQSFRYLINVYSETRPDIVHLNYSFQPAPATAAKLMGLCLVTHCRSAHLDGCADQLRNSDLIIAVSDFVARLVIRQEVSAGYVHAIWDSVDCRLFRRCIDDRAKARRKLGIPPGAKVVLCVARFDFNKRHDLLLRALSAVKPRVPDLFLLMNGEAIGESGAYDLASTLLDSMDMRRWCKVIPFAEDIRDLHAASDLMVLCSDREGCGRSVAEAMAMEVPVITTDNGGTREIISHGNTGFVVNAGDVEQLSSQVLEAFREPNLCKQIALEARRFAERELDSRTAASQVISLYDGILEGLPICENTLSLTAKVNTDSRSL